MLSMVWDFLIEPVVIVDIGVVDMDEYGFLTDVVSSSDWTQNDIFPSEDPC